MIKVGIAGAAGYTGGELIRILLNHPQVEILFAHSKSSESKYFYEVHHDLLGLSDAKFTGDIDRSADVLFLCMGHHESIKFLEEYNLPDSMVIIDLSQDFRHQAKSRFQNRTFVYGLPEKNRERIKQTKSIANPGCFATAIELALLPLTTSGLAGKEIHVNATTGSTGAGQSLSATSHFSRRVANLSAYKIFTHQHLKEIGETLEIPASVENDFVFVPQRGAFSRGIYASISLKTDQSEAALKALYESYYASHPFVFLAPFEVDLKQVVNTNFCYLQMQKEGDWLHLVSVIDNLVKGASGQAVQNMNIIFGLDESTGLRLKPVAF